VGGGRTGDGIAEWRQKISEAPSLAGLREKIERALSFRARFEGLLEQFFLTRLLNPGIGGRMRGLLDALNGRWEVIMG
jgi:hypothetical protein